MSSLRQKEIARANGARSKGPVTAAGKARSSQNARRRGFLHQLVVTGSEAKKGFKNILDQHLDRFGQLDGVEFGILEEMTVAHWRMRRAWLVEKEWMDQSAAAHRQIGATGAATTFKDVVPSAHYRALDRYETRMYRIYQRSLKTLLLLRAHPPQSQESAEKLPVGTAPAENLENAKTNRNQNPELAA